MMIVFSAVIISLPTLLAQNDYWLLLIISIILAALTMQYLWQARVTGELATYESKVLRPVIPTVR